MSLTLLISLLAAAVVMMILERRGAPVTLNLKFKGDLKRETRWLAQYGQGACTLAVAAILWCLDNRPRARATPLVILLIGVFGTGIACMILKRILGRVRPGRENAGRFLGFTWQHANYRESFPSSHSASAVAMSIILIGLYPPAAPVFWALAIICALLRYVMDAHWPSDVLAGVAMGYAAGWLTLSLLGA